MSNSPPQARNKWCSLNLNPPPLSADERVPSLLWYTSGYSTSFTKPPPTVGELRTSKRRKASSSGKGWRLRDVLLGRRKARKLTVPAETIKDQRGKKQEDKGMGGGDTSTSAGSAETVSKKEDEEHVTSKDSGAISEHSDVGSDKGTETAPVAGSHAGSEVGSHDSAAKSAAEGDGKGVAEEEAIREHDKAGVEAEGAETEDEDEAGKHQGGEKAEE